MAQICIIMGIVKTVKRWSFSRNVSKATKFLIKLDRAMRIHPHWKRKQFWKDFTKSDKFRKTCFMELPGVLEK